MPSIFLGPLVTVCFFFTASFAAGYSDQVHAELFIVVTSLLAGEIAICANLIVRKTGALIDCIKERKEP